MIKTENSKEMQTIQISTNTAVNNLAREQEFCLMRLKETMTHPFLDKWQWLEWHTQAVVLQLSNYTRNSFFLDNEALWCHLLASEKNMEYREFTIQLIYSHLEITFAEARIELAQRETGKMPDGLM